MKQKQMNILTGTVPELDADVRVRERVERHGETQLLAPRGAVVVVQHQRLVRRAPGAARPPHTLLTNAPFTLIIFIN